MIRLILASAFLLSIFCISCGGANGSALERVPYDGAQPAQNYLENVWPSSLPSDAPQPWEQLNANGYVIPAAGGGRSASAVSGSSEFTTGVERYLDGGNAVDNGEATSLSSTSGSISHAVYRIPLGGSEPGIVSADVNTTSGSGYYVGIGDYFRHTWQWHGPFTDNHVRLDVSDTSSADFTSPLGNVLVCIVAYGGASCDVVGIGIDAIDTGDSDAPPAPDTPTVTPMNGGLLLEWSSVIAGDLAGYRIYHASQWFYDGLGHGVQVEDSLEGFNTYFLPAATQAYVRISAVDTSGNESPLSDYISDTPLVDGAEPVIVSVSAPSGGLNDAITITASGAEQFDFDLDGDGKFDITGTTTTTQNVTTTQLGIIRPAVRGTSTDGMSYARGGASVVISGNSRPVASATASPQSGNAPLVVGFTGLGSDQEDGPLALSYAWDLDGDGTYEPDTNLLVLANEYTTPGIYGVKFRVTDIEGAWDVDTVPILVTGPDPSNQEPVADLTSDISIGYTPEVVLFDASGSDDPDGSIVKYEWDFDGNGSWDSYSDVDTISHRYTAAGVYEAVLRVTDDSGAQATDSITMHIRTYIEVDSFNDRGAYNSIAVVDGNPAVSYYDETTERLIYARAFDSRGDEWGQPVVVDFGYDGFVFHSVGWFSSLVVVDGFPAICYLDTTEDTLRYARANDAHGDSWGAPVNVVQFIAEGYCSLAIVDGFPAISYSSTSQKLNYVRATNAQGTAWGSPVVVDPTADRGYYSSLVVVDGKPAICYQHEGPGISYIRATDAQGTVWDVPELISATGRFPGNMAIVDGVPAVSFFEPAGFDLHYVRATDAQGGAWGAPVVVDTEGTTGTYSHLAVIGGLPFIAFRGQGFLSSATAMDAQGGSWDVAQVIDPRYATNELSVVEIDDHPAVSYFNVSARDLQYVMLY